MEKWTSNRPKGDQAHKLVCLVASLCVLLFSALPAMAGTIVVGQPADAYTGNCFPFGCAYSGEYQQVYTHSLFSGPIKITGLEFFNTAYNSGATAMNSGTWDISLSTTSADWNTLSSTYASNIGTGNTLVFSGNLSQPWTFGDTLNIAFSSPFNYNPASGNLLMDVNVSGASAPGGNLYFDTNGYNYGGFNGNTSLGRVYYGSVNSGYGLVTGFTTATSTTATPEPASLLLFASGLATLGGFLKRKSLPTSSDPT
jgi:hypothetical protein